MSPIRIVLADGHANVRALLRARLSREPDFEIVGEATHSAQAMRLARDAQPHVVVMDPIMRDGHGLAALYDIVKQSPQTAVVVLSAFSDTALRLELRRIGVRCILDKDIEPERLVTTIRALGQSSKFICQGELIV
ncbi:MAG: response regulator transcription factor [Chloroflexota bacterium]